MKWWEPLGKRSESYSKVESIQSLKMKDYAWRIEEDHQTREETGIGKADRRVGMNYLN